MTDDHNSRPDRREEEEFEETYRRLWGEPPKPVGASPRPAQRHAAPPDRVGSPPEKDAPAPPEAPWRELDSRIGHVERELAEIRGQQAMLAAELRAAVDLLTLLVQTLEPEPSPENRERLAKILEDLRAGGEAPATRRRRRRASGSRGD